MCWGKGSRKFGFKNVVHWQSKSKNKINNGLKIGMDRIYKVLHAQSLTIHQRVLDALVNDDKEKEMNQMELS